MYYTYVLIDKDNKFYIGFSSNLKQRLEEHSEGKVYSTKHKLPVKIIYYEAVINKYDALNREKYLKSGPGHKFLSNRIKYYLKRAGAR